MKRTVSRIKALFRLYQLDLLNGTESFDVDTEEIEYDQAFCEQLINGVIEYKSRIDRTIALNLSKYSIDRLSYVDRNLLRIGTYELLYTDTPKEVIINEVIEISKEYSQTEDYLSSKFNHSVLDNIAKMVKK